MKKIFLSALFMMTVNMMSANAATTTEQTQQDPRYFQISSVKVTPLHAMEEKLYFNDLSTMALPGNSSVNVPGSLGEVADQLDITNVILDKIINMGKKLWNIVEAGRPVANVSTVVATALPQGVQAWNQLEQWQAPRSQAFRVTVQNGFGANTVDFVYRVIYVAGGSVAGKGKYIGYATVEPGLVEVLWGYSFNTEITIPAVYNVGTSENPVGAMNLNVKWTVDTVLFHSQQSQSYYINALGQMQTLN